MSAVIRPDELAAHIALLENARSIHALINEVRETAAVGAFGTKAEQIITTDELVGVLLSRLTDIETQMANRNVTLKRPDLPKIVRPTPEAAKEASQ